MLAFGLLGQYHYTPTANCGMLAGARDQPAKIVLSTQLGMDRLVPTLGLADGPWAARAVRTGAYLVVAAFAEALADGMDGGKIENIEAHGGDVGQARLQVPESAMPARLGAGRARE